MKKINLQTSSRLTDEYGKLAPACQSIRHTLKHASTHCAGLATIDRASMNSI